MSMTKRPIRNYSCEIVNLDSMVPEDHFLRVIEKHFDWNFVYDEYNDIYICPNEKDLIPTGRIDKNGYIIYKACEEDCKNCPLV